MPDRFSWLNTNSWPSFDGPGYVFLGRALQRVGAHLFPDAWTARDPIDPEGQERFRAAKEAIRKHCAYGDLIAAQLWEHDGSYNPLKASIWNTSKFDSWFKNCQISSADAYGSSTGSNSYYWLFIGEKGLDELVKPAPAPAPLTATQGGYLSPYMVLMFDVIREFSIDAENQSKKDSILEFIEKEWVRRRLPDSDKCRTAMATMVRLPESQHGGQSRRAKKVSP